MTNPSRFRNDTPIDMHFKIHVRTSNLHQNLPSRPCRCGLAMEKSLHGDPPKSRSIGASDVSCSRHTHTDHTNKDCLSQSFWLIRNYSRSSIEDRPTDHAHLGDSESSQSSDSTLTLASCFLYSLASKSIKCRGYPMSIIVTQSLSWETESNIVL